MTHFKYTFIFPEVKYAFNVNTASPLLSQSEEKVLVFCVIQSQFKEKFSFHETLLLPTFFHIREWKWLVSQQVIFCRHLLVIVVIYNGILKKKNCHIMLVFLNLLFP